MTAEALRLVEDVDGQTVRLFRRRRRPDLDAAARLVSSKALRLVALAASAGAARANRTEAPIRLLAASAAGGHVAAAGISRIVRRRRPRTAREGSGSFPSTHAASAFAVGHAVGTCAPRLRAAALGTACVIGASRVVLGEHYPTDVVGGAILGLAVAQAVVRRRSRATGTA